jgi:hypothetical protein
MEDEARGDMREGCHVDSPDNDVTIENLATGKTVVDRFSMRTSLNTDKVFVLCLTTAFSPRLFAEFDCDKCVEIYNVPELLKRCRRALRKLLYIDKTGLLFRNVEYYLFNTNCSLDISIPTNIPFLKHAAFSDQHEFRLAFGRKNVFQKSTKRLIIDQDWDTAPDHLNGRPATKFLRIGSIEDISRTISRD